MVVLEGDAVGVHGLALGNLFPPRCHFAWQFHESAILHQVFRVVIVGETLVSIPVEIIVAGIEWEPGATQIAQGPFPHQGCTVTSSLH